MTADEFTALINTINDPSWVDYVSMVGIIVAAIGLLLSAQQIRLNRRVANAELQRARKEYAVETLSRFASGLGAEYQGLSMVTMELDLAGLEKLKSAKPFEIGLDAVPIMQNMIASAFPEKSISEGAGEGTRYRLSPAEASALNHIAVQYLNHVETALIPAFSGVADRKVVLEQMRPFFVSPISDRVGGLRKVYGAEMLPNTHMMMKLVEAEEKIAEEEHNTVSRI